MNLKTLHTYLGDLLQAGVQPDLPVVSLVESWPCEIYDVAMLTGDYSGDPHPKLPAFAHRTGAMLVLVPITEDVSELLNPRDDTGVTTHIGNDLPLDSPYPD